MHPSIYAVIFAALLLAVPTIAFWRILDVGQRAYAIGFLLLVCFSFVFEPFQNPVDQRIHWSWAWSPPTYVDEQMAEIVTPELVEKIKAQTDVPVSPDFIRDSTTKNMNTLLDRRSRTLVILILGGIGWFILPSRINLVISKWKAA